MWEKRKKPRRPILERKRGSPFCSRSRVQHQETNDCQGSTKVSEILGVANCHFHPRKSGRLLDYHDEAAID